MAIFMERPHILLSQSHIVEYPVCYTSIIHPCWTFFLSFWVNTGEAYFYFLQEKLTSTFYRRSLLLLFQKHWRLLISIHGIHRIESDRTPWCIQTQMPLSLARWACWIRITLHFCFRSWPSSQLESSRLLLALHCVQYSNHSNTHFTQVVYYRCTKYRFGKQ